MNDDVGKFEELLYSHMMINLGYWFVIKADQQYMANLVLLQESEHCPALKQKHSNMLLMFDADLA